MKESSFFESIKEEVVRDKKAVGTKPLTAGEYEEIEEKPMILKDYWLSLRQSIQEKLETEELTTKEQERTKLLKELITSELITEYNQILQDFNSKTKKSAEHPQREFVDINNSEFSGKIENWIENLVNEVKSKKEAGLNENDLEELRAQAWLFFNSVGNVMNTKSLENDITEFYQGQVSEASGKNQPAKQKSKLVQDLQNRYPLDKIEVEILVDLIKSEKDGSENYSPKILVETIARLWNEYKLGEKKGAIAKISLGYLMSKGVESFAPSLYQNLIVQDKFNVAVFLEYSGLNKISEIIDVKIDIESAKLMNEINHQINERITNSLFFQEFEFIHEKSLGEIFTVLERGKGAIEEILQSTISRFVPTLAGIGMSLAFLTKINPILGMISMGSLPIMYKMAKNQNNLVGPMYEKEKREGEKITTHLASIKSGFEEVKTSPEVSSVAHHVKERMNIIDTLATERSVEQIKARLKRMIPFDLSTITAAGVGGALQEAGMISGGAILANITYSRELNWSVQALVNLYFDQFFRYIQDIQRMEEILGKYEKLDLPEGEKEKDRISVNQLENFDISIKNLKYKNILRGVSLEIKQGEFLTIFGTSGAGKSTLLRNLVGLYKPDSGEIEIGGVKNDQIKKYGKGSLYSAMSYCNSKPQIFDQMTLRENLLLWSKEEINDEKIKKVLKDLHLEKFYDQLDEEVKYFSDGERVRIGVARTLIKGAKIMLLDEPTASLDSQSATEVRKIITEINEKYPETTIICVSHDKELIELGKRSVDMTELQK
ncbi:ABC transporter ATP-binding protein [Candidatus Azambacteria bacterium]|nr:ABC transporter ATP-binding protein [Candidatus Azambacteria bacterium]